ncbi:RNA polymerase sigma factor [Candidatus Aminicenantes bacterium AC-335-K20]|nr:RNA polymerase sigma factor [SCandidatus Aminicenantes bacterium Aminicenantia_JdfR_composite]MCP2597901.1 RNA polymerase sigma factor [Candidatus Aminicenantes bacterium AC-335-L06]MCP2619448.1 RNA polymerase sigma factor [Candidatus Aminicenantes bacterium AC-335-K20]
MGKLIENRIVREKDCLLEWVKKSKNGDIKAFELIYEYFKIQIFNLAYRYTNNHVIAEDLVHDIFIKAFTNIRKLEEEKSFKKWLFRIAVNTCLDYLRKHKRIQSENISSSEAQIGKGEYTITNEILELAISNLPFKMKTVFLLHDVQGFKHEEIARILKCSIGTSKSQLFKARKKIREYLIKRGGIGK